MPVVRSACCTRRACGGSLPPTGLRKVLSGHRLHLPALLGSPPLRVADPVTGSSPDDRCATSLRKTARLGPSPGSLDTPPCTGRRRRSRRWATERRPLPTSGRLPSPPVPGTWRLVTILAIRAGGRQVIILAPTYPLCVPGQLQSPPRLGCGASTPASCRRLNARASSPAGRLRHDSPRPAEELTHLRPASSAAARRRSVRPATTRRRRMTSMTSRNRSRHHHDAAAAWRLSGLTAIAIPTVAAGFNSGLDGLILGSSRKTQHRRLRPDPDRPRRADHDRHDLRPDRRPHRGYTARKKSRAHGSPHSPPPFTDLHRRPGSPTRATADGDPAG